MSDDEYDLENDVINIKETETSTETEPKKTESGILFEDEDAISDPSSEQDILNKEAISNYYKLKFQYESKINDFKRKIIGNPSLTKKEKRSRFLKFVPKCIICKRNGGSIFSNKDRILKAVCGASPPCKLDIEIEHGEYTSREYAVKLLSENFEKLKTSIIRTKLDLLFNYIDESSAVKNFEEKRKELNEAGEMYNFFLTDTLLITDNPTKFNNIETSTTRLYLRIQELQILMKDFNTEQKEELINDAVELYKSKILPTADRIRNLKYAYNAVEYDEKNNTYHLIQNPYTIVQLEKNIGQTIKILKNNY
jgi:hypothetical protein